MNARLAQSRVGGIEREASYLRQKVNELRQEGIGGKDADEWLDVAQARMRSAAVALQTAMDLIGAEGQHKEGTESCY